MKKLAIIVPERDRAEHMKIFVPFMQDLLDKENLDYKILIVTQDDNKPFNRAKLLNIGFDLANDCDWFAFHDIDMLPVDSDYSFVNGPTHLATMVEQFNYSLPYDGYFGGVTLFDRNSFEKINGYSNEYWGWGAEDDDVLFRCNIMGVETFRKGCKYRSLNHERKIEHKPYMDNLDKLRLFHQNPTEEYILKDGLSTLEYEKTGIEKISDVTTVIKVKI
jgi:predicted glycosyltransferase involved in capsule biosynthesis